MLARNVPHALGLVALAFAAASPASGQCQPGFEYDPNDPIVVTGSVGAFAAVFIADCGGCYDPDPDEGSISLDAQLVPTQCGPNTLNPPAVVLQPACDATCGQGCDVEVGDASAQYSTGYTINANGTVIKLNAGTLFQSVLYFARIGREFDSNGSASGGAFDEQLQVTIPFSINKSGKLRVFNSSLVLEGTCAGGNTTVEASWTVGGPGGFQIADNYLLTACSSQSWSGPSQFNVSPGDYVFTAAYSSRSTHGVSCMPAEQCGSCEVSEEYQANDAFDVELRFSALVGG